MANAEHAKNSFGGPWTEIKLEAISGYLNFYQKALKNQVFETWYIDAFAGTGDRHAKVLTGGLLEGTPSTEEVQILDGSVRRALQIDPPFDHFWFAEQHRGRQKVLASLQREFARDIQVFPGEANDGLRSLFNSSPWIGPKAGLQRAVVFLDPFGMSVGFSTLEMLAATRRVDVWYLFPRAAVIQQLANDHDALDHGKRASLARVFGCDDWEERFYQAQPAQGDLFGGPPTRAIIRKANSNEIAAFMRERFGKVFAYVSDPLPLMIKGHDFFELYCLSNNVRAISLITKGVDHVLQKHAPASRRKSVR